MMAWVVPASCVEHRATCPSGAMLSYPGQEGWLDIQLDIRNGQMLWTVCHLSQLWYMINNIKGDQGENMDYHRHHQEMDRGVMEHHHNHHQEGDQGVILEYHHHHQGGGQVVDQHLEINRGKGVSIR